MKPYLIAIAGGSGSGKSTLAFALMDKYPNKISIIHLDDYHKKPDEVQELEGVKNWDSPQAIDFEKLCKDLQDLRTGKSITVMTKNQRDNQDYRKTKTRIPIKVIANPIIILEGYLSLYDEKIRKILSISIFLDLDNNTRLSRRAQFNDPVYEQKILIPMHQEFVEPTKQFADCVINTTKLSIEETVKIVEDLIKDFLENN